MQVCVLGPLVIREGSSTVPVGGAVQRRILARLALEPGSSVTFDELEQAAWGDDPPVASRHTIAGHVFRLRRLGIDVETAGDRYRLRTTSDLVELTQLATESRAAREAGDTHRASSCIGLALALSRGRPFAELDDLPEVAIAAARIEDLIEDLREARLTLAIDERASTEVIADARRMVAEQPYRERRWELLMLALYRAGRQAEALDAYAQCRRRLVDDLGIDPGVSLRRMQQAVLAQDPALDPPANDVPADARAVGAEASALGGQPARDRLLMPGTSTRLIGREETLEDLAEAGVRARLVSIVGPPGAGKTRLALEFARAARPPAWYVPLEQLSASQSVAAAILDVVSPASRAPEASNGLARAIGNAAGLLVLDGAEARSTDVALQVTSLLTACPSLRILVTSRERLGLLDEALVPLGPLADDDAIALLVDRARLLDPHFRLSETDRLEAARLCGLVDRLPLGIELVARHLQLLGVAEVAARVASDLPRWAGAPAGGRPGLWAALDASVERLGADERRALRALAVMVADADVALVDATAGFDADGTDGFELLARLVDASLVQVRGPGGPTRYELLRTVAAHTVATAGEDELAGARERYRAAVLDRAAALAGQLASADRSETLRLLDREMPHVREVLGILAQPDPGHTAAARLGLELAVALTDFWLGRQPAEGIDWLGRLLDAADPAPSLRAEALLARGHLAYWVTDFSFGAALADEALTLFAALGDPVGEGRALRRLGAIAAATDDLPSARTFLEASLTRLEVAAAEPEIGTTLLHLGSLLADEGLVNDALPALERARALAVATGDPLAQGHALAALTLAHWKAGALEAAMQAGTQALLIFHELGHRPTEGTVAYRLSAVSRGLGRPRAARRYADVAIDAGRRSDTRTTIAIGNLDLARLDLDSGDRRAAATHLLDALERIDPEADRWVLVDALEAVARLLAWTAASAPDGRSATATAGALLATADAIRLAIHQPVAPTEAADLAWTVDRVAADGPLIPGPREVVGSAPAPADALSLAIAAVHDALATTPATRDRTRSFRADGA